MSNPKGASGPYMNSRMKSNLDKFDVISNAMNKKGRSKSRRINPHKTMDSGDIQVNENR